MNKHKCLKQPGQPPRNLIAKISVTSRALLRNIYGWQKAIKTKEMIENSSASNDCRFTLTHFTHFIFFSLQNNLDYVDPQIANLLFEAGQSSTNIGYNI